MEPLMRFAFSALCALALAACGQTTTHPTPDIPPAAATLEASALDASEITAAEAINACYLTAAQVSEALGGSYSDGVASQIIPQMRSCAYDAQENQLRVNVTWIDPTQVSAWRAQLRTPLAGQVSDVTDDDDGGIFQMQADIGTCAIIFVRGNLQYELRSMTCRGAPESERARLLRLPRPA
jgi:hypothetical protein